jgi:hypothetical protein
MNKKHDFRIETGFYLLAFLAAIAIRFFCLGNSTLNDAEAHLALQSLAASRGEPSLLTDQPLLALLNTVLFFIFESSNFSARFVPAILGSLFTLSPILFQKYLGKLPAVLLAFAIAFDPALVAVSRQLDGSGVGLALLITTIGLVLNGRAAFAGVCLGLALLSGPSFWMGSVILLIVAMAEKWLTSKNDVDKTQRFDDKDQFWWQDQVFLRTLGIWCAGTFFITGTLFLLVPNGISSSMNGLIRFVQGWGIPSGIRIQESLFALLAYCYFPLALALWRVLANLRSMSQVDRIAIWWFTAAVIINILYPGRQINDLVWAVVPIWILACRQMILLVPSEFEDDDFGYTLGLGIFIFLVMCFVLLNGLTLLNQGVDVQAFQIRMVAVIGGLVIILLSAILARWGWSEAIASYGLAWSLSAFLFVSMLGVTWTSLNYSKNKGMEMWTKAPAIGEADLLLKTIGDVSEWSKGDRTVIDIAVLQQESTALKWLMRNLPNTVDYPGSLPVGKEPSMIITDDQSMLQLGASYTGQDFNWQIQPAWQLYTTREWFSWLFYRKAPVQSQSIILWVRSDLFPGAGTTVSEAASDTLLIGE